VIGAVADPGATAFVCGSARFTLAMESHLLAAGQPTDSIRVERFGPSGDSEGELDE
jgi:ferredoxin-NADP reductase